MKGLGLILILILIGASCEKKESGVDPACSQEAVVKDLTGLDGCGFVLELSDGTRLIPERRTYIQAPDLQDDPIYHFELTDGKKVKISYRDSELLGACMAGEIVFITCITSFETDIE
jgi:hypothetical protein